MPMTKIYAIHPGYIHSGNDLDRRYVTAHQLIGLYRVDPRKCVIVTEANAHTMGRDPALVHLYPRYSGDYSLFKAQDRQL